MTKPTARPMRFMILALSLIWLGSLAEARVTRIQITSRVVVADGMSFGNSGPYEKLRGTAFFEVDPNDPRNAVVFDLDKAPRNAQGLVEFSADFMILKPVDPLRGNGELFFDVNNLGRMNSLRIFNGGQPLTDPITAADFGNGFLLRQGYTIALVGWESDLARGGNRLTASFPIAMQKGKPIEELILNDYADVRGASTEPVYTVQLSGSPTVRSYEAVSTDQIEAMAELRLRPSDSPRPPGPEIPKGEVIPPDQWSFATCPNGPPGAPSKTDLCLAGGFHNDMVYQLIYRATKSPVSGLGYATTRDLISFLRNADFDDAGTPNPVSKVTSVLCFGTSQTGYYLRDFLYHGFNEDEQGNRVCDGAFINVAGAVSLPLNYRFAQPTRAAPQHSARYVPNTNFPRAYAIREDPLTGHPDGILKRTDTDPKVFHTDTSHEYWQFRASLVGTDEDGMEDVDDPANVRRFLYSSAQHVPGDISSRGIGGRQCQQFSNPLDHGPLGRALLVALDRWVRDEGSPPDSRVPRIADGTLTASDQETTGFPSIPGITYNGVYNAHGERDFGPRVTHRSGVIDYLIPQVLSVHGVLVPRVDEIGNDLAGIRLPFVEAPVATLTGWNLRTEEFTDGDLCGLNGMMIPLHRTLAERLEAGDPRASLEELYGDHTGYVLKVAEAALNLWFQRLMLLEDVFQTIREADESNVLK